MGLDDLLARLERAAGTAGTADVPADVPANPLQTLAGTAGTAGTAEKGKGGVDSSETLPSDTAPPIRATRWLLHYADREPLEVWFAPAADHDEALVRYPDAVAAEPLPEMLAQSAHEPARQSAARGCSTCRHRKRPGLSAGYCGGGRDDLPGAYGLHHPLRKLPADQGESCASYLPHEG
ncbi:hypothetical protein [Thauera sp. WB-2]|uniref:hypothetical protein n=1 Tax=Thauera sp. WB-2 TaxID=2897772 RepID=UPI0022DE18C6|nr:hypothetical protein [Thauera sp. WB-2]WBL65013.1 hypothetical protein LQF09_04095 [Thauera sp. WB-2]